MSKSVRDSIREMRDNAEKVVPKFFKSGGFGKYLRPSDLREGETVLRIAPPHDPINFPSPFMPSRYTYLTVELPLDELSSYNIKDVIEKQKLEEAFGVSKASEVIEWELSDLLAKAKTILGEAFKTKVTKRIFIASQHAKEGTIDLVEFYIQWVVDKISSEVDDKDERSKKLAPIFGARVQGKWKPGINPSTNFVCYGWDWSDDKKPLYKIEIYGKMMNRILELYDKFDDGEKAITVDSFSDPETGIGLVFKKGKDKNSKWEFVIEDVPYLHGKYGSYTKFQESFKLTEDQLKELKELNSLVDSFGRGVFKAKDFDFQLNGLILFDEENKFGAFHNDEFLNKVEEIAAQFQRDEENAETNEESDAKTGADIDKMFAEKEAQKRKEAEEAEKRRIAEELAAKAKQVEENSVKEEPTTKVDPKPSNKLGNRLDALRKNLK